MNTVQAKSHNRGGGVVSAEQAPLPTAGRPAWLPGLLLGLILCSSVAGSASAGVQAGHSALWHNPEYAGEGLLLEVLDSERANFYWYTYDDSGRQRWLTGVGSIEGSELFFDEVLATRGGRFGPDFDPDDVELELVGQLSIRFHDCATGVLDYQVLGHAGSRDIERLSATMGVDCSPFLGRPIRSGTAAWSGSWLDRTQAGAGFALQWMARNEALLTWFTYDSEGEQYWLIGEGRLNAAGTLVIPELLSTRGGKFGQPAQAEDIELIEWGELTLDLSCDTGQAHYASIFPEFGVGDLSLHRLTYLSELDCPLFMPAIGDLDSLQWDHRFHVAGVSNSFANPPQIYDFLTTTEGEFLATGEFSWHGPDMVPPLLRLDPGSRQWEPHLDVDSLIVSALANHDELGLALAKQSGRFEPPAMFPLQGEILLADEHGQHTIGRYDGAVRRMLWHQGQLWVAGWFQLENGGPAHLAIWDGTDWQQPPGGGASDAVLALESDGDGLLVGGQFKAIGGINAQSIARFDGGSWTAYDLPGRVYALERTSTDLYAAGAIAEQGSPEPRGGVYRWTGDDWRLVGDGFSYGEVAFVPGVVTDIREFKGDLYAVGCFNHVNGPPHFPDSEPAHSIARWTGVHWEALFEGSGSSPQHYIQQGVCGSEPHPGVIWSVHMQRLGVHEDLLYIGGSFSGLANVDSHSLIAFDGERFLAQGEPGLGRTGGYLDQLATGGPDESVYGLVRANDEPGGVNFHVGRFDESLGWQAFGPSLPLGDSCRLLESALMVTSDETIFVGCLDLRFEEDPTGLSSVPRVLVLEGESWRDIANAGDFDSPLDFFITLDPDDQLWLMGGYVESLGSGTGFIARLQGDLFELVEDTFDGPVRQLAFAPQRSDQGGRAFVAGGTFTRIGSDAMNFIAHWDGQVWSALGAGLENVPVGIEYGRRSIFASVSDDSLKLGAWKGEVWTELATPESGFPPLAGSASFNQISEVGDRVFLAGNAFPTSEVWDTFGGARLFVYEGEQFRSLGGGATGDVRAFSVRDDSIWVRGGLIVVDPYGDPVSSLGLGRLYWP